MGSGILVRSGDAEWTSPPISAFTSETELQRLIQKQPSLIPSVGEDAVAVTELQSGVGPADVCIVDAAGDITIVECKLASNAEVRRKIVGQVLDYASQIWQMTFHEFDARWRQRNEGTGIVESIGDASAVDIPTTISPNLAEGRFDLVLAVDRINGDLRRIIEYLNHITRPETTITAFELRYAKYNGVEILVPAVYGVEIAAAKVNAAPSQQWSPDDVLDWLDHNEPGSANYVRTLFEACRDAGWTVEGTSAQAPSAIVGLQLPGGSVWPYTLYIYPSGLRLAVNFQWIHRAELATQHEFLDYLAERCDSIDAAGVRAANFRKRPGFRVADVAALLSVNDLVAAVKLLH